MSSRLEKVITFHKFKLNIYVVGLGAAAGIEWAGGEVRWMRMRVYGARARVYGLLVWCLSAVFRYSRHEFVLQFFIFVFFNFAINLDGFFLLPPNLNDSLESRIISTRFEHSAVKLSKDFVHSTSISDHSATTIIPSNSLNIPAPFCTNAKLVALRRFIILRRGVAWYSTAFYKNKRKWFTSALNHTQPYNSQRPAPKKTL